MGRRTKGTAKWPVMERGRGARSREAGTFGAASDVRVLVKDGVAQSGVTVPARGRDLLRKRRGGKRDKALAMIGECGRDSASALDVGIAMVAGTSADWRMGKVAKENMGLAMAMRLVRDGEAVATRDNRFMLAKQIDVAVPPVVRVEDVPAPGFVRVPGGGA